MTLHWSSAHEGRVWNWCLPFSSGKPTKQTKSKKSISVIWFEVGSSQDLKSNAGADLRQEV